MAKYLDGNGLSRLWTRVKNYVDSKTGGENPYYKVPDNFAVGSTVWLDGIECIVIAKNITIQGSNCKNIAIDKNYDLGWYCKYYGTYWNSQVSVPVANIKRWIWGGYGTSTANTSKDVGYGLQNTKNYLANTVNATNGNSSTNNVNYPSVYKGLSDFRNAHGDKWFLPSSSELVLVYSTGVYQNLSFDSSTGASSASYNFWSSSESTTSDNIFYMNLSRGDTYVDYKYNYNYVRLCRAF